MLKILLMVLREQCRARNTPTIRIVSSVILLLFLAAYAHADEPCRVIRGRAHLYGGDGRLRIWEVGTHHEYQPDSSSWDNVVKWLEEGVPESEMSKYASAPSLVYLYADFMICPTEPFQKGSVQQAKIKSAAHRRYVYESPLKP